MRVQVPPVDLWRVRNLNSELKGQSKVQMEFTLVLPHGLKVTERARADSYYSGGRY